MPLCKTLFPFQTGGVFQTGCSTSGVPLRPIGQAHASGIFVSAMLMTLVAVEADRTNGEGRSRRIECHESHPPAPSIVRNHRTFEGWTLPMDVAETWDPFEPKTPKMRRSEV